MEMDYEFDKKNFVEIDGFVEGGKQFDLEINVDEDRRDVIYGIVKDSCGKTIKDAVVKLVEVTKHDRKPISHTFTNKDGEFVFGPLCPDKKYAINIWANTVEHVKICKTIKNDRKCLKGIDICCDFYEPDKNEKLEN